MPSRFCTSCIGCQSSSGSHTSWQFWHIKFGARPLRFIYIAESQNALAAELYVQLPFRCLTNRSQEQTSLSVLSGLQHRLSGTQSLPQTVLISDSLTVFKSRHKTFLFKQAFTKHWSDLSPAPLKLRPYRNSIIIIIKSNHFFYGMCWPPFQQILWKSVQWFLPKPAIWQTNKCWWKRNLLVRRKNYSRRLWTMCVIVWGTADSSLPATFSKLISERKFLVFITWKMQNYI